MRRRGTAQVAQLQTDMAAVLAEQRALEHALEEYVSGEIRAMALLDGQRAGQQRCRRLIEEKIEAVRSLQDELDLLLPRQRKPEE